MYLVSFYNAQQFSITFIWCTMFLPFIHTHTYIYIYIYIYIYVCVCIYIYIYIYIWVNLQKRKLLVWQDVLKCFFFTFKLRQTTLLDYLLTLWIHINDSLMIFIFCVHLFKDHMHCFLSLVLPYYFGHFKGV